MSWSNGERSWQETVHAVDCLAAVLQARGIGFEKYSEWLKIDSGHTVLPQIESFHLCDDGEIRTVTTIETSHPDVRSAGVFEYQHATAENLSSAIVRGFEGWLSIDWPVLQDAVRKVPENCTVIEMPFPGKDASSKHLRRVLLGPVIVCQENPSSISDVEHGSFCPCCMFTRSVEAFKPLLEGPGFHAIRFFAMREAEGSVQADSRINGLDSEEIMTRLRSYVEEWPGEGFETRKQYIIIQDG